MLLQQNKKDLFENLIEGGNQVLKNLDYEELKKLFGQIILHFIYLSLSKIHKILFMNYLKKSPRPKVHKLSYTNKIHINLLF